MKLRHLLAPAIAAACIATTAPAANAQVYRHHDRVGDMASYDAATDTISPAPAERNGDVVRSTISHGGKAVTMTIAMRELKRTPDEDLGFVFSVRDSKGKTSMLVVGAGPGIWHGYRFFLSERKGVKDCAAARHRIGYAARKVTVTIPRRCLGNPTWVRGTSFVDRSIGGDSDLRAGSSRARAQRVFDAVRHDVSPALRTGDRQDYQEFIDSSHSQAVDDGYHWSPRLRRG